MQARWGHHGEGSIIALAPASVQDMFDFTIEAFNLSERYRVPVFIMSDEIVGHMSEKVVIPKADKIRTVERKKPDGPKEDFLLYKPDADGVAPMPVFRDSATLDAAAVAAAPQALFEAPVSGAGQRADWTRAAELARTTRLMLAGGLDPDNVTAAIERVAPWGVAVSSGVEARRGVKDRDKITAFIRAVGK